MDSIKQRLKQIVTKIYVFVRAAVAAVVLGMIETFGSPRGRRLLAVGAMIGSVLLLVLRPPVRVVAPGEVGVRINRLTGNMSVLGEGPAMVLPLLQELRRFPLRDQIYKPTASASAEGAAPYQTVEGLSVGVSVAVRYAIDRDRAGDIARRLPANIGQELVEPVVDGVLHRSLAKHTVREIFTEKRVEIQQDIEQELRALLAKDGIALRSLFIGHVDLPEKYRTGMEGLLAEELATEKMRFTLQLKEKEIEQRRLEAEARKVQRMKDAEGDAEARKIEASAEADSRRKLSDADAYRIEVTGKAQSEQLARDSLLIAKNPLLIQKTLADKLSDKIQVIVAPPAAGGFFAGGLIGTQPRGQVTAAVNTKTAPANDNGGE